MFTANFNSIVQSSTGDIVAEVTYSNGNMNITKTYTDANAASVKATINNALIQYQAAEDFVISAPTIPFTSLI